VIAGRKEDTESTYQDERSRQTRHADLDLVGAWSASLELAIPTFEDVPVGARVAHRAGPLDQC